MHDSHACVQATLLATRQMLGALIGFSCQAQHFHNFFAAHLGGAAAQPVQTTEIAKVLGDG